MKRYFPQKEESIPRKTIKEYKKLLARLKKEIQKVVVGQHEVIEQVIISLICDAHALLEGVPGLAKSLLVETLSRCITGTTFRRIQFVPDMLPSDILGVNAFNPATGGFYIIKGPIFANFILADEINRAPPKTQAAMMEAMQERKINIHKEEFLLDRPFLVLATQNPLEQQGVYPLPEAVVDRFFMKILVDYPNWDEEMEILDRNTLVKYNIFEDVKPVMDKQTILAMQRDVRKIYVSPPVKEYILKIVMATRKKDEKVKYSKYIRYGASPRGSISLALAARAVAIMDGRDFVTPGDVKLVVHPVLRHRIILNYEGKAAGISTDEIINEILDEVEVP